MTLNKSKMPPVCSIQVWPCHGSLDQAWHSLGLSDVQLIPVCGWRQLTTELCHLPTATCLIFKQWFLVLQNAVFSSVCTWQLSFLVPWNNSSTFFFSVLSNRPRQQSCHSVLKAWGIEAWSCLSSGIVQVTVVLSAPSHIPSRSRQLLRKWFRRKGWHFGSNQVKSHERKNLKIIPSTTFFGRIEPEAKRGFGVWYSSTCLTGPSTEEKTDVLKGKGKKNAWNTTYVNQCLENKPRICSWVIFLANTERKTEEQVAN